MRIYQGGPMRGVDNYNFQAFEFGAAYLRALGHDVVSPHEIDIAEAFVACDYTWGWPEGHSWVDINSCRIFSNVQLTDKFSFEAAITRDIAAICTVDAVSFLPGWEESAGCRIEDQVRAWLGLPRFIHEPFQYFHEHSQKELSA